MKHDLYRLTTLSDGIFYVVASNETEAANMVSAAWEKWEYTKNKGTVVKIELIACAGRYPPELSYGNRLPWLLCGVNNEA